MEQLEKNKNKSFEDIKHIDENGIEYWYARELQIVLNYKEWRKFDGVIQRAKKACINSSINELDHFVEADKMVRIGSGAERMQKDYKLTRYACYLIAQNGDTRKKVIALAQTYFAIQTRKQEISEKEYSSLTEEEKRFYQRNLTKKGNYSLNQTAKKAGVKNFDRFHNSGYKGLYNGETADDIAKRKGLRYKCQYINEQKIQNKNVQKCKLCNLRRFIFYFFYFIFYSIGSACNINNMRMMQ